MGLRVGESKDQLLGGADVFLPDDFRLAVDALTLAQVVVRPAADDFFNEARQYLGHTINPDGLSRTCIIAINT